MIHLKEERRWREEKKTIHIRKLFELKYYFQNKFKQMIEQYTKLKAIFLPIFSYFICEQKLREIFLLLNVTNNRHNDVANRHKTKDNPDEMKEIAQIKEKQNQTAK